MVTSSLRMCFPILSLPLLTGCLTGNVEDVWTPQVLSDSLASKGWHILYPPDSKFGPGVIMRLDENNVPHFVGTLNACKLTDALDVIPGAAPSINFKKTTGYSASILLTIKGVASLGPEISRVKSVDLQISDSGADAIDLLKFQVAYTDPANAGIIPNACKSYFTANNHYLVNEAFRVSKATYTLHQEDGAKLKVTDGLIGKLLNLGGELGAEVTADGDIAITKPVYLAVRKAMETDGLWTSLGQASASTAKTADEALQERNKSIREW